MLLLSRIKARVKAQFLRMPRYTCLETFERSAHAAKRPLQALNTIRVEVLFEGGKEYFDAPGGKHFHETALGELASTGLIGNGLFAAHVHNLFVDDNGLFQYQGEEDFNGRRAARFTYRVPLLQSGYSIVTPGASAVVATTGTFWADPVTYDLIRLVIDGAELPAELGMSRLSSTIDYGYVQIGETPVLLAQGGSMSVERTEGGAAYNRFYFTHCQEYHAESSVSFDEPSVPLFSAPAASIPDQPLRAGLPIAITLTTPLSERSAIGDVVEGTATGTNPAAREAITDGAVVRGRLRSLERGIDEGGFFAVSIEFTVIEIRGRAQRFFADFSGAGPLPGFEMQTPKTRTLLDLGQPLDLDPDPTRTPADLPGVAEFFLRGQKFTLPAGFRMLWKTRAM